MNSENDKLHPHRTIPSLYWNGLKLKVLYFTWSAWNNLFQTEVIWHTELFWNVNKVKFNKCSSFSNINIKQNLVEYKVHIKDGNCLGAKRKYENRKKLRDKRQFYMWFYGRCWNLWETNINKFISKRV